MILSATGLGIKEFPQSGQKEGGMEGGKEGER